MRFVFFLGGLVGGIFTTICFAHAPAKGLELTGNNDHDRWMAVAFFCVTIIGLAFTYLCVKEVFAPTRRPPAK